MKKTQQTFGDGAIIFREGDQSDAAYVIVSGSVEIGKQGDDGPVRLALLGAGELFGEMGVLDQGRRSATARAVGDVVVNTVTRKDFLAGVRDRPDMALDIMAQLAARLRGADDMLAHRGPAAPDGGAKPLHLTRADAADAPLSAAGGQGLLARFFGVPGLTRRERIHIQVAPLEGEDGPLHAKLIQQALEKCKGIRVRMLKKRLPFDADALPGEQLDAIVKAARRSLAEADDDVLVWGDVPSPGLTMHLRFVSHADWEEDQPGRFGPAAVLPLPVGFAGGMADILHASVLAATAPKSEGKAAALARELPLALDAARFAMDALSGDLTRRERGLVHTCHASALALVAQSRGDLALFRRAADAFRACSDHLTEKDTPGEWARAQMQFGLVLQAIGERAGDTQELEGAAEAFRAALRVLTRDDDPRDWAAVQNRLGEALFRLDFDSGDTETLKHALGAYQAALQVYSRAEYPLRWAEVMNNFAQVTQVLGEQLKNSEALEKAADACRAALEVRTKTKVPLLWAATQNNLGSALFLLGKLTRNVHHLQGAAEAFDLAGSVYRARGMERMAAVTEKNLNHVNQMLGDSQPKGVS